MELGFIRIGFDVSVWPLDANDGESVFTNSFPGTTCFEWIATMTPNDVVSKVISHLLNTSATTADEDEKSAKKVKLLREWMRVLRLALVVDPLKGTAASAPSPPRSNYDSLLMSSGRLIPSSSSSSSHQPSSLVILEPEVPIKNQDSVLKSVRTTGLFRTLETAIVVLPFDYEAQRRESEQKQAESNQRKRELILKASSEDMQRKFQSIRNRDDLVRKHADQLRNSFNSKVLEQDIPQLRELTEKAKNISEQKKKLVSKVEAMEAEWKKDLVVVEQALRRLDDRIQLYRGEKNEIEEMLHDLHHSNSSLY